MQVRAQSAVILLENTNLRLEISQYLRFFIVLLFLSVWSLKANGQSDNTDGKKESIFDMLEDIGDFEVVLKLPLDTIIAQKLTANEHKAEATFRVKDSTFLSLPVKLSVRGKFRRRTCDIPPIKFDFDKDDLRDLGLSNADEYKLVTHCLSESEAPDFLRREFMAYKIYENLSEYSYRSLIFPITYIDTYSGQVVESIGFMLESNDELPDRFGGSWCDSKFVKQDTIDPYYLEFMALFNYMIGNEDVIYHAQHNSRLLKLPGKDLLIPVPYDFDFSLLVAAPYAFKDEGIGYERKYVGFEENAVHMEEIIEIFLNARSDIESDIENCSFLSKREKKRCLKIIKSFYNDLEKKDNKVNYHQ